MQQVGSDEGGEPKPVRAHIMRERNAGEDHGAREGADGVFEFHGLAVVEFKSVEESASGALGSIRQVGQPWRLI